MATRAYETAPLDTLLAAIPSLPRPILARLTARMIERLDEIDGDPDLEEPGDLEGIDEREPENWIGGDGDELSRWHLPAGSFHEPHPDLARIKRQLRRIKGGARTH